MLQLAYRGLDFAGRFFKMTKICESQCNEIDETSSLKNL